LGEKQTAVRGRISEGAGPIQSQIWNLVLELMRTQEEFANRCVVVDCDLDDVPMYHKYISFFLPSLAGFEFAVGYLEESGDKISHYILLPACYKKRYFGFLDVLRSENPYP